jgi:hypothetical protein
MAYLQYFNDRNALMGLLLENPFTPIFLASILAAIALLVVTLLTKSDLVASLAPVAVFLIAYFETYQKVPGFPPIGATSKIVYVALFAAVASLTIDKLAHTRIVRASVALAISIFAVVWIGFPRLAESDAEFIATAIGLAVVGAFVLWRVDDVAMAQAPEGGGAIALAFLGALAAIFAPVALFGGSSTSVGLCLGVAAGYAICSIAHLLAPRRLGAVAILGAGAGFLAIVDTIVLITRRADLVVLPIVALSPLLGQFGVWMLSGSTRRRAVWIWIGAGLAALSPLPVIVTLLFLRHENPLGN